MHYHKSGSRKKRIEPQGWAILPFPMNSVKRMAGYHLYWCGSAPSPERPDTVSASQPASTYTSTNNTYVVTMKPAVAAQTYDVPLKPISQDPIPVDDVHLNDFLYSRIG